MSLLTLLSPTKAQETVAVRIFIRENALVATEYFISEKRQVQVAVTGESDGTHPPFSFLFDHH